MVLDQQVLAKHMMRHADGWTEQARRNTAITAIMLTSDAESIHAGHQAFDEGRCRIDAKLISDLYASCPAALKIALATAPALVHLEPCDFKPIFLDAYRRKPMKVLQRREFAYSLQMFLARNPDSIGDYEHIILELLRSRSHELSLQGVRLAGFLNRLEERDFELVRNKLRSPDPGFRMNALNAFCDMLKRPRQVEPGVLAACTSKEARSLFQMMEKRDRNAAVRLSARYALKALRRLQAHRGVARQFRVTASAVDTTPSASGDAPWGVSPRRPRRRVF